MKQTLTEIRTEYWITQGRQFVRKLLHPCSVCKKLNSRPYRYPQHSDLPEFRFDERFPFSSIGVDYLGTLYCYPVYGERKVYKAFVVLFTCASTRAVTLEVVHDGKASTFINCFIRFISRRGSPNMVISDNASVFSADETQTFMVNRFIEWKFNLEAAPWWGGMYERLVASVKRCMKKVVGVRTLTFIELQTFVAEIEFILNNRPIGADYDDDVDEVLTPNHLIFGRTVSSTGEQRVLTNMREDESLSKRTRGIESMLNHFWNRWRLEYVTALREVHRPFKGQGSEEIQVNDIVIVFDDKLPRHLWRVGKVTQLLAGADSKVRGAMVKLAKTGNIMKRPVNKLYPFVQRKSFVDTSENKDEAQEYNLNNEIVNATKLGNKTGNDGSVTDTSNMNTRSVDSISDRKKLPIDTEAMDNRVRRKAAVIGDLRRKKLGKC